MESSWVEFVSSCRSRMSALERSCFLRRRYWRLKCRAAKEARQELGAEPNQCQARCQQIEQQQAGLGG